MECLGNLLTEASSIGPGGVLIEAGNGPVWRYPGCLISNVYVRGGVSAVDGSDVWFTFDDIRGLHDQIADHFLEADAPIKGEVFRFLRKELLLTIDDVSSLTGADAQAITDWEENKGFAVDGCVDFIRSAYSVFRTNGIYPEVSSAQNRA